MQPVNLAKLISEGLSFFFISLIVKWLSVLFLLLSQLWDKFSAWRARKAARLQDQKNHPGKYFPSRFPCLFSVWCGFQLSRSKISPNFPPLNIVFLLSPSFDL